jgi:serralysin
MASQYDLADGKPTDGKNPYIDSLVWGGAWTDGNSGKITIKLGYGSGSTESPFYFFNANAQAWNQIEQTAVKRAVAAWGAVANVEFVFTTKTPDIKLLKFSQSDLDNFIGSSPEDETLGFMDAPELGLTGNIGGFNAEGEGWTDAGLQQGGLGYAVLLHEFGHGLGLAHPHGAGYPSDATAFPGVLSSFDYGKYNLNQGIFTTMSYNDGWSARFPSHEDNSFGLQATPMALDIAAIQAIYGANKSYHTGNDVYVLPSVNGPGTYWSCIWDAGGSDTISAQGSIISVTINLNEAPLVGPRAGGYVSSGVDIIGGYTIAKNAKIEKAVGGENSDKLIGNATNNWLSGSAGDDWLYGNDGKDRLMGGLGADHLIGGDQSDRFIYQSPDEGNDFIKKFGSDDFLVFQSLAFGELRTGTLQKSAFVSHKTNQAHDLNDRFIFRQSDDTLWYDSDGNATGAAPVLIADLSNDFKLAATDILIV